MFFLASPFVSDFLVNTAINHNIPINADERLLESSERLRYAYKLGIVNTAKDVPEKIIFNDPAAIELLREKNPEHVAVELANLLSDKFNFRCQSEHISPNISFRLINSSDLHKHKQSPIGYPCVIKPVKGISSVGVYKCMCPADWYKAINDLKQLPKSLSAYKKSAIDTQKYLVESLIEGDEYAIDAYFDEKGNPIVLSCYQHLFGCEYDISDQLYCTNKVIVRENLEKIENSLKALSNTFNLRNFAVHAELRISDDNGVQFIEVNPARFSGTDSPKLAYYFCRINPFHYFFQNIRPDWQQILNNQDDDTYSFLFISKMKSWDWSKPVINVSDLSAKFDNLLGYTIHQKNDCDLIKAFFFSKSQSFSEAIHLSRLNVEEYFSISEDTPSRP